MICRWCEKGKGCKCEEIQIKKNKGGWLGTSISASGTSYNVVEQSSQTESSPRTKAGNALVERMRRRYLK